MIDNEKQYVAFLIQSIEKEAEAKGLKSTDDLQVQWGELKLILSQFKKEDMLFDSFEDAMLCCSCGKSTKVTRAEQFVVKLDSPDISAKCLDCLINILKMDQTELQQIKAYQWFLKEQNLEDDFESFVSEVKNHMED